MLEYLRMLLRLYVSSLGLIRLRVWLTVDFILLWHIDRTHRTLYHIYFFSIIYHILSNKRLWSICSKLAALIRNVMNLLWDVLLIHSLRIFLELIDFYFLALEVLVRLLYLILNHLLPVWVLNNCKFRKMSLDTCSQPSLSCLKLLRDWR